MHLASRVILLRREKFLKCHHQRIVVQLLTLCPGCEDKWDKGGVLSICFCFCYCFCFCFCFCFCICFCSCSCSCSGGPEVVRGRARQASWLLSVCGKMQGVFQPLPLGVRAEWVLVCDGDWVHWPTVSSPLVAGWLTGPYIVWGAATRLAKIARQILVAV